MDIGKFFSQNQSESLVNFGVQIRGLILHNVKVILNDILNATQTHNALVNELKRYWFKRE